MVSRISHTTVDCRDAFALSEWWKGVLAYTDLPGDPNEPGHEECMIVDPESGYRLLFIQVSDVKSVKNRLHLDLAPVDGLRDEEVERVRALGATEVADRRRPDGTGWVVLADPEGNEFCVLRSDAERAATYVPVTFENCAQVEGPFFHGTKVEMAEGDELAPGYGSNYHAGRVSNNIYFSAALESAVWGAEVSAALAGTGERGHVYVVEPLGPFEDDPNVTNKRFPGNPTRSYRSRHPLRVVGEVHEWQGHEPEVLNNMLESLAQLRAEGRDLIED